MYFSLNGQEFQDQPIISLPNIYDETEAAKNLSVPLMHKVAKFIKLRFYFSADWLMMSEIAFDTREFIITLNVR